MAAYTITWITGYLAVGHAPMSFDDLDRIKEAGIDAIVNLCGEYCDLHEIEKQSGFEVYYLPIPDECSPDLEAMEQALSWLDEAIYLGKKVLVHCRHGIGRTGTFVSAYLLRRGFGLKVTEKKIKKTIAAETNYNQWQFLKKYSKQSGTLSIREPSLESRNIVELGGFFAEYKALVRQVEEKAAAAAQTSGAARDCGAGSDACCRRYFELTLIEAIVLNNKINRHLASNQRQEVINRAVSISQQLRENAAKSSSPDSPIINENAYNTAGLICPLSVGKNCLIHAYRPLRCRIWGLPPDELEIPQIKKALSDISKNVFLALSDIPPGREELVFPCHDVLSGRFVQIYFYYLSSL